MIPQGGVHDARIVGIDPHVGRTGDVVDIKHALEAYPAIFRAVHPALRGRRPRAALSSHEKQVRVAWMHLDAADLAGIEKPHMLPGLAAIGGAVHPVAVACRDAADRRRAGTDINHVRIRGGDRDGADRADIEPAVGNIFPGPAGVGGLPHATAGGAHVIGQIIPDYALDRGHPAAAGRAEVAKLKAVKVGFGLFGLQSRESAAGEKRD